MAAPALHIIRTTTAWEPEGLYWVDTHATECADLHAEVDDADGEVWSSLCVQHDIGPEVVVSMRREDWLALMTQCEQAIRYMDKLQGEINGR
jgi:hypothetical protein